MPTYAIIISIVTYVIGAVTKMKWNYLHNKYIPIQNVVIAFISAFICFFSKIEPNFLQALVLCFSATMCAGGTYDLIKVFDKNNNIDNNN